MPDRRTRPDKLGEQRQASNECWLARCLPSEVLPFSWGRFLDELLAADGLRRANRLGSSRIPNVHAPRRAEREAAIPRTSKNEAGNCA